jgi:hypothetical protein
MSYNYNNIRQIYKFIIHYEFLHLVHGYVQQVLNKVLFKISQLFIDEKQLLIPY